MQKVVVFSKPFSSGRNSCQELYDVTGEIYRIQHLVWILDADMMLSVPENIFEDKNKQSHQEIQAKTAMAETMKDIESVVHLYRSHGWAQVCKLVGTSKPSITKRLTKYWADHQDDEELEEIDRLLHKKSGFVDRIIQVEQEIRALDDSRAARKAIAAGTVVTVVPAEEPAAKKKVKKAKPVSPADPVQTVPTVPTVAPPLLPPLQATICIGPSIGYVPSMSQVRQDEEEEEDEENEGPPPLPTISFVLVEEARRRCRCRPLRCRLCRLLPRSPPESPVQGRTRRRRSPLRLQSQSSPRRRRGPVETGVAHGAAEPAEPAEPDTLPEAVSKRKRSPEDGGHETKKTKTLQ
jgi:hypothetical protein